MKRKQRWWVILVVALTLTIFLMMALAMPGWGMPGQSVLRQTVPELIPRAYLPLVVRNYTGVFSSGGEGVPSFGR